MHPHCSTCIQSTTMKHNIQYDEYCQYENKFIEKFNTEVKYDVYSFNDKSKYNDVDIVCIYNITNIDVLIRALCIVFRNDEISNIYKRYIVIRNMLYRYYLVNNMNIENDQSYLDKLEVMMNNCVNILSVHKEYKHIFNESELYDEYNEEDYDEEYFNELGRIVDKECNLE